MTTFNVIVAVYFIFGIFLVRGKITPPPDKNVILGSL